MLATISRNYFWIFAWEDFKYNFKTLVRWTRLREFKHLKSFFLKIEIKTGNELLRIFFIALTNWAIPLVEAGFEPTTHKLSEVILYYDTVFQRAIMKRSMNGIRTLPCGFSQMKYLHKTASYILTISFQFLVILSHKSNYHHWNIYYNFKSKNISSPDVIRTHIFFQTI